MSDDSLPPDFIGAGGAGPAPDVSAGSGANPPVLAGSPGSSQASGPPQIGKPLLYSLIQGMVSPPQRASAPGQLARPVSRLDVFENFLGNFIGALGSGLSAAHGPGAFGKGFGAAVTEPLQRAQQQYGMQQQAQAQQSSIAAQQAQTENLQARTAQMGQMVTLPDGTELPYSLAVKAYPALISGQARETAADITAKGRITATQIQQGVMADVPQEIQDKFGVPDRLPIKTLNTLESAAGKPLTVVRGENDAYLFNKQTGQKTPIGVGNPALGRPVQVGDPNTPGGVTYTTGGSAVRGGAQAPSSATVTTPKKVIQDFTSGASAKTLNAFNTATEHLQTLSQLGQALQNGSTPLINKFANAYATATGEAAPTSFNMAKTAVAGEVAKTFKGNATEGEIASINKVISDAQSPAQLKGAIDTALTLMGSKKQALMQQYQQGLKGNPAFNGAAQTGAVNRIQVQIPGQGPGWIDASQLKAFHAKYPAARVIQ